MADAVGRTSVSLAARSLRAALWSGSASSLVLVVGFARAVALARLLPIELFGIYSLAAAVVSLTGSLAQFGMREALVHRAAETRDESQAAAIHFTLTLMVSITWGLLVVGAAWLLTTGLLRTALLVLAGAHVLRQVASTPRTLLVRRVQHRRLSFLTAIDSLVTAGVAVGLATSGLGLWALLSIDVVGAALALTAFYAWRPVWRPRLAWSPSGVRYFLRFGSRNVAGTVLEAALRRTDRLWIGLMLDSYALGLYSRADRFARIPGNLLAGPVISVGGGAFAELANDPPRLAPAFRRAADLTLWVGLLAAGGLLLLAPAFVGILLGDRWLPMLGSFRILAAALPLALLNALLAQLFLARGVPGTVVRVRLGQLAVLAVGLAALTPIWGPAGAATGVAASSLAGLVFGLRHARDHVPLSARRLLLPPGGAALAAGALAVAGSAVLFSGSSTPMRVGVQALVYTAAYGLLLLGLARRGLVG